MIILLHVFFSVLTTILAVPYVPYAAPYVGFGLNPLLPKAIVPNAGILSAPGYGGYPRVDLYSLPNEMPYSLAGFQHPYYPYNHVEPDVLYSRIAQEAALRRIDWEKTALDVARLKEKLLNQQVLLNSKTKQSQQLANLQKGYETLQTELTNLIKKSKAQAETTLVDASKAQLLAI